MGTPNEQRTRREVSRRAARRAQAERHKRVRIALAGAFLLVAAGTAVTLVGRDDERTTDSVASASAGGLLTSAPPWPAQPVGLSERARDLCFPPLGDESYHAHALLSAHRDGETLPVPADLGYDERGAHSSLHTHTPDGVIHMEADDPYPYGLGHVFTTWDVAFDRNRLGGDAANGDKHVHVHLHVNGGPAPEGPVVLKDQDNVVVAYGTADSFPRLPPAEALAGA